MCKATEKVTAMDVVNGDVIYAHGYRGTVSNVVHHPADNPSATHAPDNLPCARYTVAVNGTDKQRAFQWTSGGNVLAKVCREVRQPN